MTHVDRTIAIVDDDPSLLRTLGRLLSLSGFNVDLYSSAEDFLAGPPPISVALILIDINLGRGMSGIELAKRIRSEWHDKPIALTSASARSLAHAYDDPVPGVTILEKPFSIATLVDAIRILASS